MMERYFGAYSRGVKREKDECEAPFSPAPRRLFIEKDVEQTHLCLSFPGTTFADDERFSLAVLNNILGGGMSSRLFQLIREEKGLRTRCIHTPPRTVFPACLRSMREPRRPMRTKSSG
jgi:predicted Zn-dependent peptidase